MVIDASFYSSTHILTDKGYIRINKLNPKEHGLIISHDGSKDAGKYVTTHDYQVVSENKPKPLTTLTHPKYLDFILECDIKEGLDILIPSFDIVDKDETMNESYGIQFTGKDSGYLITCGKNPNIGIGFMVGYRHKSE